jgi:hypothetical protein
VAKELLDKDADINATDNDGRTALIWGILLLIAISFIISISIIYHI